MKQNQRVYIKGDCKRGAEVIKMLIDFGGRNSHFLNGKNPNAYYFINPNGIIVNNYYIGSEAFSYVKEFYKEIQLQRWKPKYDENYYFINYRGMVMRNTWVNSVNEDTMYEFGNCFRTQEDALAVRNKIKNFLNDNK